MSDFAAVRFTNWTNRDFIGYWNKVAYTIKAHETIMLEEYLAKHFAEHLIDRETDSLLIKRKNDDGSYADFRFNELVNKCFNASDPVVAEDAAQLATKMMNDRQTVLNNEKAPKKVEPLPVIEEGFVFNGKTYKTETAMKTAMTIAKKKESEQEFEDIK